MARGDSSVAQSDVFAYSPTADAAFSLNVCPERRVMVT